LDGESVALEPYRWPQTYAYSHLLHVSAALGPRWLAALAAVSYELESSGRFAWLPHLLPKGQGCNVVARIPGSGGSTRTFVLVAHLDAQRSGLMWRIPQPKPRNRKMQPAGALAAVALAARAKKLAILVAAFLADTITSPTVPGANDNASGVAALLELATRFTHEPLDNTEVLLVFPGSEESGMGGMRAFLDNHRLDPQTTFVLGLDTLGSGTPIVASAEGSVLPHGYRTEDLDLVDAGAKRAGEDAPERWRIAGWTDPILARFAGLPSASVLSIDRRTGMYTHYHRMDDLPDHVRIGCVERGVAVAEGTAREFADRVSRHG
jgi:hypothetical protein